MSIQRIGFGLLLTLLISGCGKMMTQMSHNIRPTANPRKTTPECVKAYDDVYKILTPLRPNGFKETQPITLGTGGCAVRVVLTRHDSLDKILDALLKANGLYTFILEPRIPVNLWIDEEPDKLPPVKDSSGKTLSTVPTDAECNTVRDKLTADPGGGVFTTVVDPIGIRTARRCYVEAVFSADAPFMKFMTWSNPTIAVGHGPFQYYLDVGTDPKVTKIVWIHIVRALPDQN